jgi:DegV family protein with EDD domain
MYVGLATGATAVLVPEHKTSNEELVEKIRQARLNGFTHYMIVVAEGAAPATEVAQIIKDATDLDALADAIRAFTDRVESSFLLDRLDYMVKGGRCSAAAALGANLLNLKPCIEVKDGKMGVVKKYRGNYAKCLASYVKERLSSREDLDTEILFITQTKVSDECYAAVKEAVAACPSFNNVYETVAGCTVSCHCGPGTLGAIFVRK